MKRVATKMADPNATFAYLLFDFVFAGFVGDHHNAIMVSQFHCNGYYP